MGGLQCCRVGFLQCPHNSSLGGTSVTPLLHYEGWCSVPYPSSSIPAYSALGLRVCACLALTKVCFGVRQFIWSSWKYNLGRVWIGKRQGPTFFTDFTGLVHLKPITEWSQQHHSHVHGIKPGGTCCLLTQEPPYPSAGNAGAAPAAWGSDAAFFASLIKSWVL